MNRLLPFLVFAYSTESTLIEVVDSFRTIHLEQSAHMMELNAQMKTFRDEMSQLFAPDGEHSVTLLGLVRKPSERIVTVIRDLDNLLEHEAWLTLLRNCLDWNNRILSLQVILDRIKAVDVRIEAIDSIFEKMQSVTFFETYPIERLGFVMLRSKSEELVKLAHEGDRTKFALRRIAYDRWSLLNYLRHADTPSILSGLISLALKVRDAVEEIGFESSPDLAMLVKDSGWDMADVLPSRDIQRLIIQMESLLNRYEQVLARRPQLSKRVLYSIKSTFTLTKVQVQVWNLYLVPSELPPFQEEMVLKLNARTEIIRLEALILEKTDRPVYISTPLDEDVNILEAICS